MSLKEQLDNTMKNAMKARDDLRLSAVRMVKAAVRNREIDQKKDLDDKEIIDVISTLVKQRRESIRLYTEGNRLELVEKEEKELAVLLEFLPKQLSVEEIEDIVKKAIKDTNASSPKDIGIVMKNVTPQTAGKADGKLVSEVVKRLIA